MRFTTRIAPLLALSLLVPTAWAEFTDSDLAKMVGEMDAVGTRNAKYAYPIKAKIVESAEVNAYSTVEKAPKGTSPRAVLVVYTGLAKALNEDPRLIRAVIAHEVSHLVLGHCGEGEFVARDLSHLWTRQQEMAADVESAKLLERAGYSKQDAIDALMYFEKLGESKVPWLQRLGADHPSAKQRAAEVAGNTSVYQAMVTFDVGLAYLQCRRFADAERLFDAAAQKEPKLTEAFVNAAQASLLHYYDMLPEAVRNSWFRPDFGPVLTNSSLVLSRDPEIRDSDRERYKAAMARIAAAKTKLPDNARVLELEALAKVLEPDGDKAIVTEGIAAMKAALDKSPAGGEKLRLANNVAVGLFRNNDWPAAFELMVGAQTDSKAFNPALAENIGRVIVGTPSERLDKMANPVMLRWLNATSHIHPWWDQIKAHYMESCDRLKIAPQDVKGKPIYLCQVISLFVGKKELGLFKPVDEITTILGAPALNVAIDPAYPDLTDLRWAGGDVEVLTERGKAMRITTRNAGDYVALRPTEMTTSVTIKIEVGMKEKDLDEILDLKTAVKAKLLGLTDLEEWSYFPSLNIGVLIVKGEVTAVTVAPVSVDGP